MNIHLRSKLHSVAFTLKNLKTASFLLAFVYLLATVTALIVSSSSTKTTSPIRDKEHLKMYPYCGQIPTPSIAPIKWPSIKDANGRVANSKKSAKEYRWIVIVWRMTRHPTITNEFKEFSCSGTVLTDR